MNTVLHKATTRGYANHGWLEANHSFSFANYYNPDRINFGSLRVLNDDRISKGMGFGSHPHDNMEIITIPLEGAISHKDSMGNGTTINSGDIQVMSAGKGIQHSEFNANKDGDTKLLQIWIFPDKREVEPRYDQITLDKTKMDNKFLQIVSPNQNDEGVWIHQHAWLHLGNFEGNTTFNYELKDKTNGLYVFVIDGKVKVNQENLEQRDALGIWDFSQTNSESIEFQTTENSRILLLEVPMGFSH